MKNLIRNISLCKTVTISMIGNLLILSLMSIFFINKLADGLVKETLNSKLKGDINSAKLYVEKYYGKISMKDGALVDSKGDKIDGNYTMVDAIQKDLGNTATIFLKKDDDFIRVATNVKKDDGTRAIGTMLGKQSAAYPSIINGKLFIGEAAILGKPYFTAYDPLIDGNGTVIGIIYIGIPKTHAEEIANSILKKMVFAIIVIGLVISMLSVFFIKKTLDTINLVVQQMRKLAEGDFSGEISDKYTKMKNEIGILFTSMKELKVYFRMIIDGVTKASADILTSTKVTVKDISELNKEIHLISASTKKLFEGMEETTASAQQMSDSAAQIETAIDSIAKKTEEQVTKTSEISFRAHQIKTNAENSKDIASNIYFKFEKKLKEAIEKSSAVKEINVLSEAILQITSQTNLLALNAAIEAARAGESGKGFAVVADEIRKLADDSKKAVSEIQSVTKIVVDSVQNLAHSSAEVMEFINNQVITDYEHMVDSGEQYAQDAFFTNDMTAEFSDTSQKLASTIENLTKVINEISESSSQSTEKTQYIAENNMIIYEKANEILDVTSEIAKNAYNLNDLVSQFKV